MKIALFSIPAHGHTNPMIAVCAELVKRGNEVRFYSFADFEEKIRKTGAQYISCDSFLPELTQKQEEKIKRVSTTEMTITDIKTTLRMNEFLENEFETFAPDVVYCDSVCFWGKLSAWKYNVPLVVSTSTFAFNRFSSTYMKYSFSEMFDMIFGLSKIKKELNSLKPYGYNVKSALSLVQSDNSTDSVVYTSKNFQPYADTFSSCYAFVGPSLLTEKIPQKEKDCPLVYVSMGTVINDRPQFYKNCIEALKDENLDLIISCGNSIEIGSFGKLPENVKVFKYVDQLDVLSRADAFITHCGMNSVSESLFMAAPMVLFPQTGEQEAVARRAKEIGAGERLNSEGIEDIKKAVMKILSDKSYSDAAEKCSRDFRSCSGAKGAAEFIETAPHASDTEKTLLDKLNVYNVIFRVIYSILQIAVVVFFCFTPLRKYAWIFGVLAGVFSYPAGKIFQNIAYKKLSKN